MRPLALSRASEGFHSVQPVVEVASVLRHTAESRGPVEQFEGALVYLCRGTAVHVLTGGGRVRPVTAKAAYHILEE